MRLALLAILAMAGTAHAAPEVLDDGGPHIGAELVGGFAIGVIAMGTGAALGGAFQSQLDHCGGASAPASRCWAIRRVREAPTSQRSGARRRVRWSPSAA